MYIIYTLCQFKKALMRLCRFCTFPRDDSLHWAPPLAVSNPTRCWRHREQPASAVSFIVMPG